jgi:phosphate ABC transporter phosphate-binding protein
VSGNPANGSKAPGAANSPANGPAPAPLPTLHRRRSIAPIIAIVVVVVIVAAGIGMGYKQHWFGGGGGSGTHTGTCPSGVTVAGNGAQFVNPLVSQWAESYSSQTQNAVNYVDGGSGTGITDLEETTVDFAITDDPLSPSETAAMPGTTLTLPVTGGALAILYNLPGVPGHLNLSGAVLTDIYMGKITHWNDPAIQDNNTGLPLPSQTIQTVHRSDAAGTTFVLTNLLSDDSVAWRQGPGTGISIAWPANPPESVGIKGNSALLSYVQTTQFTIGYSDLTDVLTASSPVQYAAVQNPTGHWIVPTLANTASALWDASNTTVFPTSAGDWYAVSAVNAPGATDYPLATFAYLFVFQNANVGFEPSLQKTQVLIQWLDWVLSTGQTEASGPNLYYVALPPSLVSIDQAGIQTITYGGAAVPACT